MGDCSPMMLGQLYFNPIPWGGPRSLWELQEDGLSIPLGNHCAFFPPTLGLLLFWTSSEGNLVPFLALAYKVLRWGTLSPAKSADRHFLASWKVDKLNSIWVLIFPTVPSTADNLQVDYPLKPCPVNSSELRADPPLQRSVTDLFFPWPSHCIMRRLGSSGIVCVRCLPMVLTLFFPILP